MGMIIMTEARELMSETVTMEVTGETISQIMDLTANTGAITTIDKVEMAIDINTVTILLIKCIQWVGHKTI
jgi:hypothetical protein